VKKFFYAFTFLTFCYVILNANTKSNSSITPVSFKLNNGLTVILSPIDNIQATCVLIYHISGVRDDPLEIKGASYLYQNLMLLGTRHLEPYERFFFVQKNGGTSDIKINFDNSISYQIIPDHQIDNALWIESERINSLIIADKNINIQKNNTYKKIYRLINSNIVFKSSNWVKSEIFKGTAYQTPIYGNLEFIRSFDNSNIKRIYNNFRNPSKIIMVISGKFDPLKIKKTIKKLFSYSFAKKETIKRKYTAIKPRKNFMHKNWVIENIPQNLLIYGVRAPSKLSFDYIYFDFIRYYLVDPRISELARIINVKNNLSVNINYEYTDNIESNALIITMSSVKRINFERAKFLINRKLQSLMDFRISSSSFKALKSLVEIDFMKNMTKLEKRSAILAENFHLFGSLDIEETYLKRLKRVTSYDILRICRKYLSKNNRVILNVYKK
jgi:zinc protease